MSAFVVIFIFWKVYMKLFMTDKASTRWLSPLSFSFGRKNWDRWKESARSLAREKARREERLLTLPIVPHASLFFFFPFFFFNLFCLPPPPPPPPRHYVFSLFPTLIEDSGAKTKWCFLMLTGCGIFLARNQVRCSKLVFNVNCVQWTILTLMY